MGIARILIGLLLVILPATQSRSNEISVANSDGLQQSQVAASQVKENLYHEFALIETQEKASDVATGDVDSQDFGGWLPPSLTGIISKTFSGSKSFQRTPATRNPLLHPFPGTFCTTASSFLFNISAFRSPACLSPACKALNIAA